MIEHLRAGGTISNGTHTITWREESEEDYLARRRKGYRIGLIWNLPNMDVGFMFCSETSEMQCRFDSLDDISKYISSGEWHKVSHTGVKV